jgi:hypothetical protein
MLEKSEQNLQRFLVEFDADALLEQFSRLGATSKVPKRTRAAGKCPTRFLELFT